MDVPPDIYKNGYMPTDKKMGPLGENPPDYIPVTALTGGDNPQALLARQHNENCEYFTYNILYFFDLVQREGVITPDGGCDGYRLNGVDKAKYFPVSQRAF